MNLLLSFQAAYTAPMLMMSQNRLAARDGTIAQDEALAKIVEVLAAKLNGAAQG